jgi:hypothetical protein
MINTNLDQILNQMEGLTQEELAVVEGFLNSSIEQKISLHKVLNLRPSQRAIITKNESGIYGVEIETGIQTPTGEESSTAAQRPLPKAAAPIKSKFPYVDIRKAPADHEYGIIHIQQEFKSFFPGYRIQFLLETDIRPFVMHMTAGTNGSRRGAEEGGYICHPKCNEIEEEFQQVRDATHHIRGSFLRWYDAHPDYQLELEEKWFRFFKLDDKHYRLETLDV